MFVQITGDEFDAKYELLKCVTEVGVRTYQAQGSDGQIVMVHFLGLGSTEDNQGRVSQIDTLPQPARDRVIEMIDIDSSIVIVTQFLTQFDNFDEWLRRESGAPGGAGSNRATASPSAETVQLQTPVEPSQTSGEPGEFSQLFSPEAASRLNEAVAIPGNHTGEPPPEEQEPRTPAAASGPDGGQPGEFTQMFGSDSTSRLDEATRVPSDAGVEPPPAQPVSAEATGEPVAAEPGEFTQMFQPTVDESTPPAGSEAAAPAADESPSSEDTQPFRPSVETAGVVDGQEPPATEPPPATPPPASRKPVIRWRGDKPTEPDSDEQPRVRWKGPQDSQPEVPLAPQVPATPPPSPVQPPAPQASVPPAASAQPPTPEPTQQGPGEFTQLFHDGSGPPAAAVPPETSGHPTDPRRSLSSMEQEDLMLGGSPPPTVDPLKAAQPPGQFTQMFRSGSGLDAPQHEVPPPATPQQPPPPEQGKKPGSFTEIFGSTGEPSDYPLPAVKPQSTPQSVQPPGTPPPGGQPPVASAPPPSAPPVPVPPPGVPPVPPMGGRPGAVPPQVRPPQAQGPGEFTRMVSDTPAAPAQMAPPPPPPGVAPVGAYADSGAETPKKSQLPLLIVGLSVILVLALVLILVVVLT